MTVKFCECRVGCKFPAAPGEPFCLTHDPRHEKQAERSRYMTKLGKTGKPVDFSEYQGAWVRLAQEMIGVQLWSHQRRALEAIEQHRRVAWKSCHGAGKSVALAAAAICFVLTYPDSLVLITAPVARQVANWWRTLRRLVNRAPVPLGGELLESPEGSQVMQTA